MPARLPFGMVVSMDHRPPKPIDPSAGAIRTLLRVVGPLLLLTGGVLVLIAFIDIIQVMRAPRHSDRSPEQFWLFFVGGPIAFVGLAMTSFAYMGRVARFQANELTPVASDAANALASSIRPALRDAASAIRDGLTGQPSSAAPCPRCRADNHPDARFCDQCGAELPPLFRHCAKCQSANDGAAKFCDECGAALA